MILRPSFVCLALSLSLLALSAVLPAQTSDRTVSGLAVTPGPAGESFSVPGAIMTLSPVSDESPEAEHPTAESDQLGVFRFRDVADGCYLISGASEGMSGASELFCLPWEGDSLQITVEMQVDAVVEEIEVTADVIEIDPTETSSRGSLGEATLDNVPKRNRSYDDAMPLIPGVLRGPSGEINMNGARASQGGAQLNGVDVTDPVVRTAQLSLPIDTVSNVQVLSSPYDAQFGGFAGAVSMVETKPSNFNEMKITVQNFTPRARKRGGRIIGIESSTPRATITGPIKKGKLAFLHSTEYQFVRAQQEDANLPVLERDTEREALSIFTQLDAHHTDQNRSTATLLIFPEKLNFFGLNTFVPQQSVPDLRRRGRLFSLRNTQEFSGGAVLQSNLSMQWLESDVRPNSLAPSRIGIERASGGFFNRQSRKAMRPRWTEQYNFRPLERLGSHQLKAGFEVGTENYDGTQIFSPVSWLGLADNPVIEMDFTEPAIVDSRKTDFGVFVQDKWSLSPSFIVDIGARVERDSIASQLNPSYRIGFAYSLGGSSRTVLRGGSGLFYDRISLFVPTFTSLPLRTYRRFSPLGALLSERQFAHRITGPLKNPKSYGWSLQVDREVFSNLFVRLGYQQRRTRRNLLIEREQGVLSPDGGLADYLTLNNTGQDSYREYQATVRYRVGGNNHFTGSYIRSSSVGDLNDIGSLFGPTPLSLIRGNERAPLAFDAPHRFLLWADIDLPKDFRAAPILELRQGFPYSHVDESRNFVGARNRAGRFPMFQTLDIQITKRFTFPVGDKRPVIRAGIRFFNILNQFNPVDIQNNLASPAFGTFYRGVDRKIRAVFEIGN